MIGAGREFVFLLTGDSSGIEKASRQAQGALRDAADSTVALDAAQGRASASSEGLASSLLKTGAGAFGLKKIGEYALDSALALIEAQINADRLNMQLGASVGAAQAGQELEYLRGVSNRLGLELNSTGTAYARFSVAARGTSLEGQGVRQVFDSVAKSAAVMGLNAGEMEGVLRALEQMMSKGTVQAEELRGQLGDRMPGALQIASRAMGVTTGELGRMVEAGQVISTDFLPRFARQLEVELGASADKAADTMQAATNRAANSWEQFKQSVAASGFGDFLKAQLNKGADGLNGVSEAYQRARESGAGFLGQTYAAQQAWFRGATDAAALKHELAGATAEVAALKAELTTNPGNIFLRPAIAQAEQLVAKLQLARTEAEAVQRSRVNLRAVDNQSLQTYTKSEEEETGRRRDALKKVTDELSGATGKLTKAQQALAKSFIAGDFAKYGADGSVIDDGRKEYTRLQNEARAQFGDKGRAGPKAKPEPLVNQLILDSKDALAELGRRAEAADSKTRDFMLDQVQKSDERVMTAQARQIDQAAKFSEELVKGTESAYAGLIVNARDRGQVQLGIERDQLNARLMLLNLDGKKREMLADEIALYLAAREAQLTEELKPEWQRRLEAWQNTAELMANTYDNIMDGLQGRTEDAFVGMLNTGKFNTKALTSFIGDELAKLAYRKYLAGGVNSFLEVGLSALFGGGGMTVDAGGYGITSGATGSLASLGLGAGRASGGGVQAGRLTPINESGAGGEMLSAGGRQYLLPAQDGWVTPLRANTGGGSGVSERPIYMNVTYNVPAGQSPAAYAAALAQNNERLKAEVAADMARPGRMLNRAAGAAA